MSEIFQLNDLELVGYLEVPILQPAMPRVLSAIFAIRDSTKILFPPYTLGLQEVMGPVMSTRDEFNDLVAREEVSTYHVTQAQPDYEIWIDDEGCIRYDPGHVARKRLVEIFEARCRKAKDALASGSWAEARAHAIVAYSANPRSLDALGYRAAAEYLMASHRPSDELSRVELALTEIIAKSHLSIPSFRSVYRELAEKYLPRPALMVVTPTVLGNKLKGITNKKPAPSRELCLA